MVQWLNALAALPEDPDSIPSTHIAKLSITPVPGGSGTLTQTHMQQTTNAYKNKSV
jgi:5,10-methylene-tetrahydrofolate dehydrogenase/methenyl tetrahydrofolate cyclohydrolase